MMSWGGKRKKSKLGESPEIIDIGGDESFGSDEKKTREQGGETQFTVQEKVKDQGKKKGDKKNRSPPPSEELRGG